MASLHNMLEKILQLYDTVHFPSFTIGQTLYYGLVHIDFSARAGDESAFLLYPLYAADCAYGIS
jgi:hypothetical protein